MGAIYVFRSLIFNSLINNLEKQKKWLDFCITNKKQLLQFNQMFFWHLSFEILFFLWTFGSHLYKDKHLMQDNVSFNIRWPFDMKSIDFYLDLEIRAYWNIFENCGINRISLVICNLNIGIKLKLHLQASILNFHSQ